MPQRFCGASSQQREADMSKARMAGFACAMLLGVVFWWIQMPALAAAAPASANKATVLQVDGIISPASSDVITRGLEQADESGSALVIIALDTPGGLDTSMRR